jgi:hypothetical protein
MAYRRETCQSVSGARRADGAMRAASASGISLPSCGRLISSGALPACRVKVSLVMRVSPGRRLS